MTWHRLDTMPRIFVAKLLSPSFIFRTRVATSRFYFQGLKKWIQPAVSLDFLYIVVRAFSRLLPPLELSSSLVPRPAYCMRAHILFHIIFSAIVNVQGFYVSSTTPTQCGQFLVSWTGTRPF